MHFSLVKSLYKNQVIWDYMTKKSPDFSQKVWLLVERNGGYKWLFFFRLVSDHVKTSSQKWRVWGGGPGKGACSPREEEVSGSVQFSKGSRRERDLSPDATLVPYPIKAFLPQPGPSVSNWVCFFPWFCQSDLTLCQCLCATVGTARTSLRGQSSHE